MELYRGWYDDFGPTLAQEMLEEKDSLEMSMSTLRRELLKAGLWKPKKKSGEYRSRRKTRLFQILDTNKILPLY